MDKKNLKQVTRGLQVVPAAATDVVAHTAWVYQLVISNIHTSAVTILVKDKAGTPLTLLSRSIAASTTEIYSFPEGVKMSGGINWIAGTADKLHAEVAAYYEPGA